MKREEASWFNNTVNDLTKALNGQTLIKLSFYLDNNPAFDVNLIPFKFQYAHKIIFSLEAGTFTLMTAQTSTGLDSLLMIKSEPKNENPDFEIEIHEPVLNTKLERGHEDLFYKMALITESFQFAFVAGEIYDSGEQTVEYKINDEMILVFSSPEDLETFEKNCI